MRCQQFGSLVCQGLAGNYGQHLSLFNLIARVHGGRFHNAAQAWHHAYRVVAVELDFADQFNAAFDFGRAGCGQFNAALFHLFGAHVDSELDLVISEAVLLAFILRIHGNTE